MGVSLFSDIVFVPEPVVLLALPDNQVEFVYDLLEYSRP